MTTLISHDTTATRYWHSLDDGRIQCDHLPKVLQIARRSTRPVLCQAKLGQSNCYDQLWQVKRLCHRSHRKKALEPFPAGNASAVVWHGRLQLGV